MTVATPWGDTYNDRSEAILAHHGMFGSEDNAPIIMPKNDGQKHIDRDHDVPLLAAALDAGNGFYGIAVDRRIPHWFTNNGHTYDPAQFVHEHERVEHEEMEKNGAPYQEAHDKVATPWEKEQVQNYAKSKGLDPESFWKEHQQFWSKHMNQANARPPEKVHPHTYLGPYEDSKHPYLEHMKKGIKDFFTEPRELPYAAQLGSSIVGTGSVSGRPASVFRDQIKDLYKGGGHTYQQIADKVGVTRQAVAGLVNRMGIAEGRTHGVPKADWDKIEVGLRRGKKPSEVAKETGYHVRTVQRVRERMQDPETGETSVRQTPSLPKLKF